MTQATNRICVLLDHAQGVIRNSALEALALSQRLAEETGAVVDLLLLCSDPAPFKQRVEALKADTATFLIAPELAEYDPDSYCSAASSFLREHRPDYLLVAHTYQNIDFAPKLSARLKSGLLTDCIGYRIEDDGRVVFTRQMFRNKLNADVVVRSSPPVIVSIQGGSATLDQLQQGSPQIVEVPVSLDELVGRRIPLETIRVGKGRVDLDKADIVVGVGRGIKKPENLKIIQELADVLGGEIGASRPVVDNEWLERERQIGSSGQSIAPKLYIACGISGAIQHVVGMKNAGCIVAINTDPNAPIFQIAHYGIVGDLFEVVPALTNALREAK